jgi:hypothetical protein
LRRIYKIRLSRPEAAAAVLGADRLLTDLSSYAGESILMAVVEHGGHIYAMLLDEEGGRLVSCTVGRDRRLIE